MSSKLLQFNLSPEILQSFRKNRSIPVDFFNKNGQTLIHKKEDASDLDLERVERFIQQGIYYREEDSKKIHKTPEPKKPPSSALSDSKLLNEKHASEMSSAAEDILEQLRSTPFNNSTAQRSASVLEKVFVDFKTQPDASNGILNIFELMSQRNEAIPTEMMVKRSIVAMSIKTRGMISVLQSNISKDTEEIVNYLMLVSFLCDISYTKMNISTSKELSQEEYKYIQTHPLISYLMLAHVETIPSIVKQNILLHHHPIRIQGFPNNNYPNLPAMKQKLIRLQEKYKDSPEKAPLVKDITTQLQLLTKNILYDEDANILSIASSFASLTTKTAWRPAFSASKAIRQMINQSLFTYSNRIMRDFLDHSAMSLCDNNKIIKEGSFIILAVSDNENRIVQFEVALVVSITHLQSKPGLRRIGTINPQIGRNPRLTIININLESFKKDPRRAYYELVQDNSRRIIYLIDAEEEPKAQETFLKASSGLKIG